MDARLRGTFLTSAGFLFASIGFVLSVLSTFLRLLFPHHLTRGADVKSTIVRRSTIRTSESKHRRRHAPSTINSSVSSVGSASSQESCSTSEMSIPKPRTLESNPSLLRATTHNHGVSDSVDRPDFRNTARRSRPRSGSAPPSPAPWALSHSPDSPQSSVDETPSHRDAAPKSSTSTFHLRRAPSMESAASFDGLPAPKSTGLSFLHRRKVHKAPSAPSGLSAAAKKSTPPPPVPPLPAIEKRKSQLFAPLLHRRRSQPVTDVARRWSQTLCPPSTEDDDAPSDGRRQSHDVAQNCLLAPKRSQTLRTQPYEAPYFFPTPGSVAAETYVPPRRKPVRSKTLGPGELERIPHADVPPLPTVS
ncbi:hypothetical protein C8R44DRAFT_864101 [Mycena epipterygia]|nr:hypothetical protein C8R44DRAFT_864101 [Mycena epipterygia]